MGAETNSAATAKTFSFALYTPYTFTFTVEIQVGASFEERTPVSFQGRKTIYFFPVSYVGR